MTNGQELMKPDPFAERLVAYVDILGWSSACQATPPDRLVLKALDAIHRHAEIHNQRFREETQSDPRMVPNPMFLEVQFGAFSDHFVWSKPVSFGARIFSCGKLVLDLLLLGFATRGAIVRGPLYHLDNIVCGAALIEAVHLEEREAFYPRILVSDQVLETCRALGHIDSGKGVAIDVLTDHLGRKVVNPFVLPLSGPDDAIGAFVEQNFRLREIRQIIVSNIEEREEEGQFGKAEKWRYLRTFIEGPVFEAEPRLRAHW